MSHTPDNATLDPQMAADMAAIEAAGATHVRPHFWTCAAPPNGCGQLKPLSEFSFKERWNGLGGGKDLCHTCKIDRPLRAAQDDLKAEVHRALTKIGQAKANVAEHVPRCQEFLAAYMQAVQGPLSAAESIVESIQNLKAAGKLTSAANLEVGMFRLSAELAKQVEQSKPVEKLTDKEMEEEENRRAKVVANFVFNYHHHEAAGPQPVTIDEYASALAQ